jgi:hypothetical protein
MRKLTPKPAYLSARTVGHPRNDARRAALHVPTELAHSVLMLDLNFFYFHIRRVQTHTKELGSFCDFDLEGSQKTS